MGNAGFISSTVLIFQSCCGGMLVLVCLAQCQLHKSRTVPSVVRAAVATEQVQMEAQSEVVQGPWQLTTASGHIIK